MAPWLTRKAACGIHEIDGTGLRRPLGEDPIAVNQDVLPGPRLRNSDHPRVRGERSGAFAFGTSLPGSPPRARGAVPGFGAVGAGIGITPACAGSGKVMQTLALAEKGSPPRARGAVKSLHDRVHQSGITPACAGSGLRAGHVPRGRRDHPRVRGERSRSPATCVTHSGSPRVRGERLKTNPGRMRAVGSPPRARGAASWPGQAAPMPGITPACAGSGCTTGSCRSSPPDHPRVRGERARGRVLS